MLSLIGVILDAVFEMIKDVIYHLPSPLRDMLGEIVTPIQITVKIILKLQRPMCYLQND